MKINGLHKFDKKIVCWQQHKMPTQNWPKVHGRVAVSHFCPLDFWNFVGFWLVALCRVGILV